MATILSDLFHHTSGDDKRLSFPLTDDISHLDPDSPYMENFMTPFTGVNTEGPIMNANANLVPTIDDSYRDWSSSHDYRLGNGIGISKSFRKPDSMLAHEGENPLHGRIIPNKNFGRSTVSHDLNNKRIDSHERAAMSLKKIGFKDNEVPKYSYYSPWQWNKQTPSNHSENQVGGNGMNNNGGYATAVRSHHPIMDADAYARRAYQPAPSRLTKMLNTDTEMESLMPQRTLMHPLKVVSEDRQRQKIQRIPKNADVIESVLFENIRPYGMGAPNGVEGHRVHARTDVLRAPIGTNDTGSRAVFDRWNNPGPQSGNDLLAEHLEDNVIRYKTDEKYIQGHDIEKEMELFMRGEQALNSFKPVDPYNYAQTISQYPNNTSTINGPMTNMPNRWPN